MYMCILYIFLHTTIFTVSITSIVKLNTFLPPTFAPSSIFSVSDSPKTPKQRRSRQKDVAANVISFNVLLSVGTSWHCSQLCLEEMLSRWEGEGMVQLIVFLGSRRKHVQTLNNLFSFKLYCRHIIGRRCVRYWLDSCTNENYVK